MNILKLTNRPKNKLVQFVKNLEDLRPSQLDFENSLYQMSEKIDGVFCLALKLDDAVTIFSRTGEIYQSMKHIEEELMSKLKNKDIIFFEATNRGTKVDQSIISGWCRDKKTQHPELVAACHNYLTLEDFCKEKSSMTFSTAEGELSLRIKDIGGHFKAGVSCYRLPSLPCRSKAHALETAQEIWRKGGEGVILKNLQASYEPGKRNASLIRIKEKVTYDLKVIDVFEGTGKYRFHGLMGGVVCQWKDGKTIRVGSGFTDVERSGDWIGKIIEVEAMRESSKGLLREPRFKRIRLDKTEGDF